MSDNLFTFTGRLLLSLGIVVGYYKCGKEMLLKLAPKLAKRTSLGETMPFLEAVGIYELVLVAVSHVLLCLSVAGVLGISWTEMGISEFSVTRVFYGIAIGAGLLGVSTVLCRCAIELGPRVMGNACPDNLSGWLTLSRAGWIRHHIHAAKNLPMPVVLAVLIMQVGSEEVMFRGIMVQYFAPFGILLSIVVSTTLFVSMQTFQMPNFASSMFPVIGSLVMGIVHGVLFAYDAALWPLIVAHITFFLLAVT